MAGRMRGRPLSSVSLPQKKTAMTAFPHCRFCRLQMLPGKHAFDFYCSRCDVTPPCPKCGGRSVVKNGHFQRKSAPGITVQGFCCRECGRNFIDLRNRITKRQHKILSVRARFLRHVKKSKTSDCWLWPSRRITFSVTRPATACGTMPAARASWLLFRGRLRKKERVVRVCKNFDCVNPAHLVKRLPRAIRREAKFFYKAALRDGGIARMRETLVPGSPTDVYRKLLLTAFDEICREKGSGLSEAFL